MSIFCSFTTICTVVCITFFDFFFCSLEDRVSIYISILHLSSPVFIDTFSLSCIFLWLLLDLEAIKSFRDISTVSSSSLLSSTVSLYFFFYLFSPLLFFALGLELYLLLFTFIVRKLISFHLNYFFSAFFFVTRTLYLISLISTSSTLLILIFYIF